MTRRAEGMGRKYVARRLKIGGTLERDLDEVADAWERAERGEEVSHRVISFEDMETFQRTLTRARLRLFRHLQKRAEPSVRALSVSLDRDYSSVHRDVAALEKAGLLVRRGNEVRAVAKHVHVEATL